MNYDPMLCAKDLDSNRAKVLIEVPIPRTSTKVLDPGIGLRLIKMNPFQVLAYFNLRLRCEWLLFCF